MRGPKRALRVYLGWAAGITLLLALAVVALVRNGERLLVSGAQETASLFAEQVARRLPELPALLERRGVVDTTLGVLQDIRASGGVFSYSLFDRAGSLVIDSDELEDDKAQALLQPVGARSLDQLSSVPMGGAALRQQATAGQPFFRLERAPEGSGRPAVFVEAWLPLRAEGRVIGIVEVCVDVSAQSQRIRTAFVEVALVVGSLMLILGAAVMTQRLLRDREQQGARARERYLAEHDALSGTLNRASFRAALASAAATGGGASTVVLVIDIDDFEGINDSLGTPGGDAVLSEVGRRLLAVVRQGDVLARLGGDRFAILQSHVGTLDDVQTLAQRMSAAVMRPIEIGGRTVHCTAGVGAAAAGSDSPGADAWLQRAESALQRAKAGGRGQLRFYDETIDKQLEDQRELLRDLRLAVENGSLTMHYQALHASDGRTLLGYEALMRWSHPRRGMVPPSLFIPLAEENGLIHALGRFALERACAEAAKWPAPLTVSVNLSAAQFGTGQDLTALVSSALQAAALPPQRLVLEITESLLMSDADGVMRDLSRLSAMGVAIAMDDFGTGYSSLAYLWRFPFNKVKIDRAFTQGLAHDDKVLLIVRSIVSLAHSLGIRVNAEGVETESQMAALQDLGCDEVQGYLLGRPMPAETLTHAGAALASPPQPAPRERLELAAV